MLATSTVLRSPVKPAWQTDELEDEWIEPTSDASGSHIVPCTDPNISPRPPACDAVSPVSGVPPRHATLSPTPPGTFLIREEQAVAPILPKPLGKDRNKALIKDFFSPLALETMFEPPSPPSAQDRNGKLVENDIEEETGHAQNKDANTHEHARLNEGEDVILASDIPNLASFDGRKPSAAYEFTFTAPRSVQVPNTISESPQSELLAGVPTTDARLRLFQFQYDTFTREHLSAMVDSIAVGTPSSNTSGAIPPTRCQPASALEPQGGVGFLRSTKRLKLSPRQDISDLGVGMRPRRDYIGESKSLMQKIKQARTPSMMSTILSVQENVQPTNVEDHGTVEDRPRRIPLGDIRSVWSSDTPSELSSSGPGANISQCPSSLVRSPAAYASSSLRPGYPTSTLNPPVSSSLFAFKSDSRLKPSSTVSALGYRQQAADLMAQIRKDMTTGKRLVSFEMPKETNLKEASQSANTNLQHQDAQTSESPPRSRDETKDMNNLQLPLIRKVSKPSPRKLLRRLSAADEVDRELALDKSSLHASLDPVEDAGVNANKFSSGLPSCSATSQLQPLTAQEFHVSAPAPKANFLLPLAPSDARRVASGGTTTSVATTDTALTRGTSATSVSAGSVGSFVKHPGPVQMMRIAPGDIPCLPDMVGGMRFDHDLMRWVKSNVGGEGAEAAPEESDDPFKSFETLESSREEEGANAPAEHTKEEVVGSVLDVLKEGKAYEDTDDSFEFDAEGSAANIVEVMTGVDSHGSETGTETTDSEVEDVPPDVPSSETEQPSENESKTGDEEPTITAPRFGSPPRRDATPAPTHRDARPLPRSVLKNGGGSLPQKSPADFTLRTPNNLFSAAHRRSVSFSDGKKDGKIRGLGREDSAGGPSPLLPTGDSGGIFVQSPRGSRIAGMLESLADPSFEEQTPSKASTSSRPTHGTIQSLGSQPPPQLQAARTASRRAFARSQKGKELSLAQSNQTILTECSFGVAHEKLVQVITDIHPYLPYWETLAEIDLSGKGVDSVLRLKEFLPQLDMLNLDQNVLSWLSGAPRTLRTLSIRSNMLTALTSFSHLTNLENLDISNNQIDSLRQLSCLRHLRELKADENRITSLEGIAELDSLTKLSIRGNSIAEITLSELRWPRMELLDLSRNKLHSISGLSSLGSLVALNLDHNRLEMLEATETMAKMRTLRVSDNRLPHLDVSRFTGLRTLYADNNRLSEVSGVQRLRKLENLSLRNQSRKRLTLAMSDIRDVKRLYLSGNPLVSSFIEESCYNLVYLEVAACRLTTLPHDFSRLVPNLRVLNLNYNFLTDARGLEGLSRLRKLTVIGSRLKGTKSLIRMLRRMPEVEMLDCRMNPCTLGWYLPILVHGVPGALQPSEDAAREGVETCAESWQELDAKFRQGLPDTAYVGRLAYRGLVMRACPRIRMLDGVAVEDREREKAQRLLVGVLGAAGRVERDAGGTPRRSD